jgi:hypothetical protein
MHDHQGGENHAGRSVVIVERKGIRGTALKRNPRRRRHEKMEKEILNIMKNRL